MFIYHNIPLLTIVVDLLENERQKIAMPFQQVLGSPPYLQIQFFHYQFLIVLPSILVSLWDLLDAFSRFAGQNHSTGLNIPQKGPQRHLGTASSLWIKLLSTVSHFWLLLGSTLCPEDHNQSALQNKFGFHFIQPSPCVWLFLHPLWEWVGEGCFVDIGGRGITRVVQLMQATLGDVPQGGDKPKEFGGQSAPRRACIPRTPGIHTSLGALWAQPACQGWSSY